MICPKREAYSSRGEFLVSNINVDDLLRILLKACAKARPHEVAGTNDSSSAPGAAELGRAELARELSDLFWSTGLMDDGSDERRLWLDLGKDTVDHAELAKGFRRVARAANPLSPKVCAGTIAEALRRKIAARKSRGFSRFADGVPPPENIDWRSLSDDEQELIRTMAWELAAYHRGFVRPHRPTKHHLDTLLFGLADIFLRHTGQSKGVLKLENAAGSHFVQFCHLALLPFTGKGQRLALFEVGQEALAYRWANLQGRRERVPQTDR